MKNNGLVILMFFLLVMAVALGYFRIVIAPTLGQRVVPTISQPVETPKPVSQEVGTDGQASPSAEVLGIMSELNSRQKVSQLMAFPVTLTNGSSPVASASSGWVSGEQPGFITLFGNKISTTSASQAITELKAASLSRLPTAVAVDHEGGKVQRLAGTGFTILPSWSDLCRKSTAERSLSLQRSALELASSGVNIVFGPVTDTSASSSGIMATRSCGPDPEINQTLINSWVQIFATQKVNSVFKHYPDLGLLNADLHDEFATVSAKPEDLDRLQKALANTAAIGVMTSHPGTQLDPALPCSQSSKCLAALRSGTAKLLFSDGLEMTAAQYRGVDQVADPLQIATAALIAGNDVLVYGPQPNRFFTLLLDGLELRYDNDPAFQKIIDRHLQRVVEYKQTLK